MIDLTLFRRVASAWVFISLLAFGQLASAANLSEIRVWHAPDSTRIVMDLDEKPNFKRFFLENPARYVIDLHGFQLTASAPQKAQGGRFVKGIRVGVPKQNVARVVLDLNQAVAVETLVLKPVKGYQHRLVFDITAKKASQKKAGQKTAGQKKTPKTSTTTAKVAPVKKTPAVPKPAKRPSGPFIIAIDPGHGGDDSGARGRRTREKDVVLQIAKRLKKKIDAQKGMRAVLTRKGDYFVKLKKRRAIAHDAGADLFISIHADGFKNSKAKGSSVYALSLRGASSAEARRLAESENAADLIGGVQLATSDNDLRKTIINLQMNSTQHESITFASAVLDQFKRIGKVHKSTVEKAGFVVLKTPDIPSILVETAYITNPKEERLLRSASYQEKLSNAILIGTMNYLKNSNYHTASYRQ
jgi:N-acetylmuramoyl-L-alanine amidase